jgi:hypothetical protein
MQQVKKPKRASPSRSLALPAFPCGPTRLLQDCGAVIRFMAPYGGAGGFMVRFCRGYLLLALCAGVLPLWGCATSDTQSYADTVLSRPMPASDGERIQECTWIRSEIARQQGLAGVGSSIATTPLMAAAYQAAVQQNVAALESRAASIQCTAAFSSAPAPSSQSFDQCFARCQQLTKRTKEQCFDVCNK